VLETHPPFPGFRRQAFDFLRSLKENNDRDWFKPRKEIYEDELIWPMQCLIADAAREASALRLPFSGDPAGSIFRIYRDTRFSKSKLPYKTHVGAILSPGGGRKEGSGLYIHIEAGSPFICAGFWRAETAVLNAWRRRIAGMPDAFLDIVQGLQENGYTFETDSSLKRIPAGLDLDPEHPAAEYLKWRDFYAMRRATEDELGRPDFTEVVVKLMRDAVPLLEFGRQTRVEH
jgi:uncharacterized protein (TIGR02453 family)